MFLTTAQWIERVKTDMEELTPDWDNVVSQTGGADIDRYIRAKWPEGSRPTIIDCTRISVSRYRHQH